MDAATCQRERVRLKNVRVTLHGPEAGTTQMSGEKQEECARSIGMRRASDLEFLRGYAVPVLATTPQTPTHIRMLAGQLNSPPQSRVECGARTQSCKHDDGCDEGEDHERGARSQPRTSKYSQHAHGTRWVLIYVVCMVHVSDAKRLVVSEVVDNATGRILLLTNERCAA